MTKNSRLHVSSACGICGGFPGATSSTLTESFGTVYSSTPYTASTACLMTSERSAASRTSRSSGPVTVSCNALLISTALARSRLRSFVQVAAGNNVGASTKPCCSMVMAMSLRNCCCRTGAGGEAAGCWARFARGRFVEGFDVRPADVAASLLPRARPSQEVPPRTSRSALFPGGGCGALSIFIQRGSTRSSTSPSSYSTLKNPSSKAATMTPRYVLGHRSRPY
mmetsp:Transcript_31174/g.101890  ORF Transcript_31174/g.101890 Transcript_31174/m.101890 type:complete len:224 (+) Transcript_31174:700-1371(+)